MTNTQTAPVYTERCPACSGTGLWGYSRPCFKCHSTGKLSFKTDRETRVAQREKAAVKRQKTIEENQRQFTAAHPEIATWCVSNKTASFARSLWEQVGSKGQLSSNQIASVQRSIDKQKAAAARVAEAPVIDLSKINAAFDSARASGLKRMALRYKGLVLKAASAQSANPGAIYVVYGDLYRGKIVPGGKFVENRDCTIDIRNLLIEFAVDPHAAAIAEGKRTGNCCCCGKLLTDKRSVDLGIGPICESKWGW